MPLATVVVYSMISLAYFCSMVLSECGHLLMLSSSAGPSHMVSGHDGLLRPEATMLCAGLVFLIGVVRLTHSVSVTARVWRAESVGSSSVGAFTTGACSTTTVWSTEAVYSMSSVDVVVCCRAVSSILVLIGVCASLHEGGDHGGNNVCALCFGVDVVSNSTHYVFFGSGCIGL